MATHDGDDQEAVSHKRWTLAFIATAGFLLILISIALPADPVLDLLRKVLKEVGVTILAVFTISYVYEIGLAKKHMQQFTARLRAEIMTGQGAASTCAVLGIDEIFRDRVMYEQQYGIVRQLQDVEGGMKIRLVARSAYTVVGHAAERFAKLVGRGAHVEICLLDPRLSDDDLAWNVDVARSDIIATLKSIRTMLADRLIAPESSERASGQLTVALHRVPMLDSFLFVSSVSKQWCTWDLSFGRDTSRKTVLMLDVKKPLGTGVAGRYEHVWKLSEKVFVFADRTAKVDVLSAIIAEAYEMERRGAGSGATPPSPSPPTAPTPRTA